MRFSSPADMQSVLDLAEAAAAVYCPPPGVTPDPPPTGPDLERRRRFHESFGSLLAAPDVPLRIRRSRTRNGEDCQLSDPPRPIGGVAKRQLM